MRDGMIECLYRTVGFHEFGPFYFSGRRVDLAYHTAPGFVGIY